MGVAPTLTRWQCKVLSSNQQQVEKLSQQAQIHIRAGDFAAAAESFTTITEVIPDSVDAHANLAFTLHSMGRLAEAERSYRAALKLNRNQPDLHNNLGLIQHAEGNTKAAIASLRSAVKMKPDYAEAHSNLGLFLYEAGDLDNADKSLQRALSLQPELADAHNHLGNVRLDQGNVKAARQSYKRAAELQPNQGEGFWNLSGTAGELDESISWLEKCLSRDPQHEKARLMLPVLAAYQGDRTALDDLLRSADESHPFVRSFAWVFSLPKLPSLHFHRWALFDAVLKRCKDERPFYEFGVWRGASFHFLLQRLGKGYGFDTFEGIPEDWDDKPEGSYSSEGNIPEMKGGEFIAGKFEDTLPEFFNDERPKAALINLDADLYSSTLCALTHAFAVIDADTILVFDEFLMNQNWENDEYRALEDFCAEKKCSYEVIALSFFTKQVAVKLLL